MHTASIPRTAPIALWRVAESFLHVLHNLFGAPEDVARDHTLTRAAYTLLLSWLRVGEDLLRRLLAIEATAFPAVQRDEALRPAHKHTPRLMSFTPDNPDAWRVSFRCLSSSPADSEGSPEPRSGKGKGRAPSLTRAGSLLSAWPLAERYEALLRAFNDPHAFARRLARRLQAHPKLLETVLRKSEHYDHRVDCAEEITEAARDAWRTSDSS